MNVKGVRASGKTADLIASLPVSKGMVPSLREFRSSPIHDQSRPRGFQLRRGDDFMIDAMFDQKFPAPQLGPREISFVSAKRVDCNGRITKSVNKQLGPAFITIEEDFFFPTTIRFDAVSG